MPLLKQMFGCGRYSSAGNPPNDSISGSQGSQHAGCAARNFFRLGHVNRHRNPGTGKVWPNQTLASGQPLWHTPHMAKKRKTKPKRKLRRTPKLDANQIAFRVLQQATTNK